VWVTLSYVYIWEENCIYHLYEYKFSILKGKEHENILSTKLFFLDKALIEESDHLYRLRVRISPHVMSIKNNLKGGKGVPIKIRENILLLNIYTLQKIYMKNL